MSGRVLFVEMFVKGVDLVLVHDSVSVVNAVAMARSSMACITIYATITETSGGTNLDFGWVVA